MKPITKRQQAILDFIKEEVDKRGYPPSVREIGLAVGLSSTASVHNQLNQLEKKGLIRKDKSTTRGIVILSPDSKQEEPKQASNVIELKSGTLQHNNNLKELYAPRVVKIGNNVLELNNSLTEFESLYLEEVGDNFLKYNRWLEKFIAPNLRKIGLYILSSNNVLIDVDISSLIDECKDNLSKYMKEMLKQETPYTLKLKY